MENIFKKIFFLENLFFSLIFKNVFTLHCVKNEDVKKMCDIVTENDILLKPNDLFQINKPLSYLAFSIKEIYEYFNLYQEKGKEFLKIKRKEKGLKKLKYICEKLQKKFNFIP
jgi:hypothetical protein